MTGRDKTVSVTEFKAKCLGLIAGVDSMKIRRVTIMKRGREVAELVAVPRKAAKRKPFGHGFLKGSVVIPKGLDLTEPIFDGKIDAAGGILHR